MNQMQIEDDVNMTALFRFIFQKELISIILVIVIPIKFYTIVKQPI